MRPTNEWTIEDLEALIRDQIPESHFIDYKRSDALSRKEAHRKELGKDVSAFANSSGGILIYGIVEENQLPKNLDSGISDDITAEWVEQTIDGNVRPRIAGLVVKIVDAPDGRRFVAIEAPQATTHAPHMANERYYRRGNSKSEPMQDYEVRDAFRRSTSPVLNVQLTPQPAKNQETSGFRFVLSVTIGNEASEPALYSSVDFSFERSLEVTEPSGFWKTGNPRQIKAGERQIKIQDFSRLMAVPQHLPIYRETRWEIATFEIVMRSHGPHHFLVRLNCPGFYAEHVGTLTFDGEGDHPVAIRFLS